MHKTLRKAALPLALVGGVGIAATVLDAVQEPIAALDAQAAPHVTQQAVPGPETLSNSFRTASQAALAGVVRVEVEAAPRAVSRQQPDLRGTPFEDFFRSPESSGRPRMGSGSGFIISPDGYILTNNHVVENATRVSVSLTDRREYPATVVARDPNTDVAVLKVDATDLPTTRIGDSDELQVGDWVLALGYPMSLGETVTAGIVSARGRSIGIMRQNKDAEAPLEHFIQTDAAINPGNSGGPLVNLRGEVVGINTAIASQTGTYTGYGFAVPIKLAKRVADDLIRYGTVHRPRIGVSIKDVEPADVEVFSLPSAAGSVVTTVPEGPAKAAGIQLGDVLVAVDGVPVKDTGDLMERIALRQPGEQVQIGIIRYGEPRRVNVRLDSFESDRPTRAEVPATEPESAGRLGFAAAELSPALAQQLRISEPGGIVITRIDPAGPAPQSLTGVRIDRINGKAIRSAADLRRVSESLRPGGTVSVIGRLPDGTQTIVNYKVRG